MKYHYGKVAALLAALGSTSAFASGVNVQSHSPTANTSYVWTESANTQSREWLFSASYNWVNDPFVELNEARTTRTGRLVDGLNTLDLLGSYRVTNRLSFGLGVPVHLVHPEGSSYAAALGDSRLFAKYRLTNDGADTVVSLIPELRLPTGSTGMHLSDGSVSPGMSLAVERDFGAFQASANIGYRYSSGAQFRDLNYSERVPVGLGVYIPIDEKWGANAEAIGALTLPRNSHQNPGEFYGGARYSVNRDLTLSGGASVGALSGAKSNDFRAMLALKYSPEPEPTLPRIDAVMITEKRPVERVIFTPKQILINDEIKFQHAKANLTPSGKLILNEVAAIILKNKANFKSILIEGHTNELGSNEYNMALSIARAKQVRSYLISRGIPARQLGTAGFGEEKPKKLSGFPKYVQLELNRRVEFKVSN